MFRNTKRLLEMNRKTNGLEERRDAEGRVVVRMTVRDDAEFLSPYSVGAESFLSSEVSEFLENGVRPKRFGTPLAVEIHSDTIDAEEKRLYAAAVKNTFRAKFVAARERSKRDAVTALFLLTAGVVFLLLMFLADFLGAGAIVLEILDIFAWVFLWEAADVFFLERTVERLEKLRALGFYESEIRFLPINKSTSESEFNAREKSADAGFSASERGGEDTGRVGAKPAEQDAESILFAPIGGDNKREDFK